MLLLFCCFPITLKRPHPKPPRREIQPHKPPSLLLFVDKAHRDIFFRLLLIIHVKTYQTQFRIRMHTHVYFLNHYKNEPRNNNLLLNSSTIVYIYIYIKFIYICVYLYIHACIYAQSQYVHSRASQNIV